MINTSFSVNTLSLLNNKSFSINELFKKLSDTSELVKELNSIQTASQPEAYASLMLTAGLDEITEKMVYNWILDQLTISEDWSTKWNQDSFMGVSSHLNFQQQFALLAGMYRLAKLGENNEPIKKHFHEAAAIFKNHLIKLIHQYPANYQKLDLNTLSLKNSTALRFDQATLSDDFLNTISKQSNLVPRVILEKDRSLNHEKISTYVKAAIATTFFTSGAATVTFIYRSFFAKQLPPPATTLLEKTEGFFEENVDVKKISVCLAIVGLLVAYFVNNHKKEARQEKYTGIALVALDKIDKLEIGDIQLIESLLIYIPQVQTFVSKLNYAFVLEKDFKALSEKIKKLPLYTDQPNSFKKSITTEIANKRKAFREAKNSEEEMNLLIKLEEELKLPVELRFFTNR